MHVCVYAPLPVLFIHCFVKGPTCTCMSNACLCVCMQLCMPVCVCVGAIFALLMKHMFLLFLHAPIILFLYTYVS